MEDNIGSSRKPLATMASETSEGIQPASQSDPNLLTVVQSKIPRTPGALRNIPVEILVMFMGQMDLVSAVCFGLACNATYKALKVKHTNPIDLMALHAHVQHDAFCRVGLAQNWTGACDCHGSPAVRPVNLTLAYYILLSTTFNTSKLAIDSFDYRLSRNRGDHRWTFVNKRVFGDRSPDDDKVGLEKVLHNRYKILAHFRSFDSYVMKGANIRLPYRSRSTPLRNKPSLIPSPSGLSYEDWTKAVIKAIVEDMDNWGGCREGWMAFWKKQSRQFMESNLFRENEQALIKAGDDYVWPPMVDQNQVEITARMVARYLSIFPDLRAQI
ncbi:uncharacterized protein PAC_06658 [Phialocephala subalpina]|uniref:Uncharacterized protein n=1 Tax=Phialocephala subalpina TaxID=576137 RepID=A0A1L7WVH6_9HELO|nr:uncharacterized protein PAC_06658 [Phialocephala subalpina]